MISFFSPSFIFSFNLILPYFPVSFSLNVPICISLTFSIPIFLNLMSPSVFLSPFLHPFQISFQHFSISFSSFRIFPVSFHFAMHDLRYPSQSFLSHVFLKGRPPPFSSRFPAPSSLPDLSYSPVQKPRYLQTRFSNIG